VYVDGKDAIKPLLSLLLISNFVRVLGIFIDENDIILTAKLCQACRRMSTSLPYVLGVL
jgi:hypothetical protein